MARCHSFISDGAAVSRSSLAAVMMIDFLVWLQPHDQTGMSNVTYGRKFFGDLRQVRHVTWTNGIPAWLFQATSMTILPSAV